MDRVVRGDMGDSSGAGEGGMRLPAIEKVLAELAAVTEEVIALSEAADAEMEKLSAVREGLIEQRVAQGVRSCQPDPRSAIADLHSTLAVRVARDYREAAREFVAWWADVATLAVIAAVTGQSVHPTRAAAADPTTWFDEDDLQHLPDVPDDVRKLAGLAARLAATPLGPAHADVGAAERAMDFAASAGLRLDRADGGQIVAKPDRTAEARRCRLWGEAWAAARIPALPNLGRAGRPVDQPRRASTDRCRCDRGDPRGRRRGRSTTTGRGTRKQRYRYR